MKSLPYVVAIASFITILSSSVNASDFEQWDQAGAVNHIALLSPQDGDDDRALPFNTKKHRMKKIQEDVEDKDTSSSHKRESIFSKLFGGNDKQEKQNTSPSTVNDSKPDNEVNVKPTETASDKTPSQPANVETTEEKSIFAKWFKFLDKDKSKVREKKSTADPFDTKNHRRGLFTQEADPTYVEKDYDPETTTAKSSSDPFDTKKHRRGLFKQEADPTYEEKEYKYDSSTSKSTAEPFDTKKHRKQSKN